MPHKILIVDDEAAQLELVAFTLRKAGFETVTARDGWDALIEVDRAHPDLIILDWMLPEMSGLDVCRELRNAAITHTLPIIVLSARASEHDRTQMLEKGADDYVTKPFSPRELVARVNALLRRSMGTLALATLSSGGLMLTPAMHNVTIDGKVVHLGPREFQLLEFLMRHPDFVYSRAQLLNAIWKDDADIDERTIDVHMSRLRRALKKVTGNKSSARHNYIRTVRGAGYAFAGSS